MEILNFVPLLVWALGFLWLNEWSEKWRAEKFNLTYEQYQKRSKENGGAMGTVWLIGCLILLLVGVRLTW